MVHFRANYAASTYLLGKADQYIVLRAPRRVLPGSHESIAPVDASHFRRISFSFGLNREPSEEEVCSRGIGIHGKEED